MYAFVFHFFPKETANEMVQNKSFSGAGFNGLNMMKPFAANVSPRNQLLAGSKRFDTANHDNILTSMFSELDSTFNKTDHIL